MMSSFLIPNHLCRTESSSEYEEDYENDSYDSDASYENTSDNQNCYLNVQGGAGSFHDQHEGKEYINEYKKR